MSERRSVGAKRPRGSYSRLICLDCRERRIRCELPGEVEIPAPGEVRTVHTPCYRCKRLGIPCRVRQTILGRPGPEKKALVAEQQAPPPTQGNTVSRVVIELLPQPATTNDETQPVSSCTLPYRTPPTRDKLLVTQRHCAPQVENTLFVHKPQSTETVIILRALDTLQYEKVDEEWFRHLPPYVGHTQALDLSIKALVAACAYTRGFPKLTSTDCYQSLALALNATQTHIQQLDEKPNDAILASTALLAPFEGVLNKHGISTHFHIKALAAILAARPETYPVSPLARDILDWYTCESTVVACIYGTPSLFEGVNRAYFANNGIASGNECDRAQLKALSNEVFIYIPRLVGLIQSLQLQSSPHPQLIFDALRLSQSLLRLQDPLSEARLLQNLGVCARTDLTATLSLCQDVRFTSVRGFEALICYWQSRLFLLRLERRLYELYSDLPADSTLSCRPKLGPQTEEMTRLVGNILASSEYAATLPLRKHGHQFAFAMLIVWGVTRDTYGQSFLDQDGDISDLLLRKCNIALRKSDLVLDAEPDFTAEDLDAAANVFVGQPLKGRFVELYGL